MKLIRCTECGDVVALSAYWRSCHCGQSAAKYNEDGDTATVAGTCRLYGLSNLLFLGMRTEAWPYNEDNGKITRLSEVPYEAIT